MNTSWDQVILGCFFLFRNLARRDRGRPKEREGGKKEKRGLKLSFFCFSLINVGNELIDCTLTRAMPKAQHEHREEEHTAKDPVAECLDCKEFFVCLLSSLC